MKYDYLIIGQGIAGSFLGWYLIDNNKSVLIIDNAHKESSSIVSAGIINPVIGKRFSIVPGFDKYYSVARDAYTKLESIFGETYFEPKPILRIFRNEEERAKWERKEDKNIGQSYISGTHQKGRFHDDLDDALGSVFVESSGHVHTQKLLEAFRTYFEDKESLQQSQFEYDHLTIDNDGIHYKDMFFKSVIFCEGYRSQFNPWFKWLPFNSVKGEVLRIKQKSQGLPEAILNKGKWCVPLGDDEWAAGATYIWDDLDCVPTEQARNEILDGLGFLKREREVLTHQAAVRPVLEDQRPVLGRHPQEHCVAIFNGLASKGFLVAPYYARMLADHFVSDSSIDEDVDVRRFREVLP